MRAGRPGRLIVPSNYFGRWVRCSVGLKSRGRRLSKTRFVGNVSRSLTGRLGAAPATLWVEWAGN